MDIELKKTNNIGNDEGFYTYHLYTKNSRVAEIYVYYEPNTVVGIGVDEGCEKYFEKYLNDDSKLENLFKVIVEKINSLKNIIIKSFVYELAYEVNGEMKLYKKGKLNYSYKME